MKPAPDWQRLVYDVLYPAEDREFLPSYPNEHDAKQCKAVLRAVRADAKRKFLASERQRWMRYLISNDEAAYSDPYRATITAATLAAMYPPRRVGGREGK